MEQRAGRAAAAARAARASMARSQRRIWHGYEVAPPTTVKLRLKLRSASTAAAAVAAAAPAPPAATQEQDAGVGHALAASRAARRAKQGSRPSSRGAAEVPGPAQPIAKTRGRRSGSSSSRPRTGLPQNRRKGGMNIPEEDLFLYHLGFIDKRVSGALGPAPANCQPTMRHSSPAASSALTHLPHAVAFRAACRGWRSRTTRAPTAWQPKSKPSCGGRYGAPCWTAA